MLILRYIFIPIVFLVASLSLLPTVTAKNWRQVPLESISSFQEKMKDPRFLFLLKKGDLFQVQKGEDNIFKQAISFSLLPASCKKVYNIIADVASHPRFLDNLEYQKVMKEGKGYKLFKWNVSLILGSMEGVKIMKLNSSKKGKKIEVRYRSGDVKVGTEIFQFIPTPKNNCIMVQQRYMDLASGSILMKLFVGFDPTIEPGLNILTNFYVNAGLKTLIKGLKALNPTFKTNLTPVTTDILEVPDWLLEMGPVSLLEYNDDMSFKQVTTAINKEISVKKWHQIVTNPLWFKKKVKLLGKIKMKAINIWDMEWNLPLIDTDVVARIKVMDKPMGLLMTAIDGDIKDGNWLWLHQKGSKGTYINFRVAANYAQMNWLTKIAVEKNKFSLHAFNLLSSHVIVNSMDK